MKNRAPRLTALAAQINAEFPWLEATIEPGFCNTDRQIKGTRLRHSGQGRRGNKLVVRARAAEPGRLRAVVYSHNAAETYRTNAEVVRWIEDVRAGRDHWGTRAALEARPKEEIDGR